jgi:hypothetical protein
MKTRSRATSAAYRSFVRGQTLPDRRDSDAYDRWLFDFLRADLGALRGGVLLGARADAWAFVRPAVVDDSEGSSLEEAFPSAAVLAEVQREARTALQVLGEGKEVARPGLTSPGGMKLRGDRLLNTVRRGTFHDLFLTTALDTIQASWPRLRKCPHCHGVFLKVGKQQYCSPLCAGRARGEAFKARHPDRRRDYHHEYERRIRQRLGRKVTVRSRQRTEGRRRG